MFCIGGLAKESTQHVNPTNLLIVGFPFSPISASVFACSTKGFRKTFIVGSLGPNQRAASITCLYLSFGGSSFSVKRISQREYFDDLNTGVPSELNVYEKLARLDRIPPDAGSFLQHSPSYISEMFVPDSSVKAIV